MADSPFPSRHSSNASRRTLQRHSSRLSQHDDLIDIFSDENAAEFMPVADGFRPASGIISNNAAGFSSPPRPSTPQPPPRAASPPRATEYLKKRIAGKERNSSLQSRTVTSGTSQRDSLVERVPGVTVPTSSTRRLSALSTRSSSTVDGVSGTASRPGNQTFAQYPHVNTLDRHASTSTVRTANRPYSGPSRPTHPYAMYPQIPVNQELDSSEALNDPGDIANVGFPGLGQNYARVRGTDTEDADDLIGPDGHTEQLPPYTRYPLDMPAKERNELGQASAPLLGSSASGPSDLVLDPLSEPSSASSLLDNDDGTRINLAAARAAGREEPNRTQRFVEKSQKRVWGKVPVWAWIVLVVLLCIIAAAMGGVMGRMVSKAPPPAPDPGSSTSTPKTWPNNGARPGSATTTVWSTVTTTLIDASPLPTTPAGMLPMQPGSFQVLIMDEAKPSTNNCMSEPHQQITWQCSGADTPLMLTVGSDPQDSTKPTVMLSAEYKPGSTLRYGPQAPAMRGPAAASAAKDIQENNDSPSWFFQQLFDKLVILRDDATNPIFQKKVAVPQPGKRNWAADQLSDAYGEDDDDDDDDVLIKRAAAENGPVLTGDMLWFCFWNNTILEGFIYTGKIVGTDATEEAALSSIMASSLDSKQAYSASQPYPAPTDKPRTRRANIPRGAGPAAPGAGSLKAQRLPYGLKLEERRGMGTTTPYCQKMIANPDGSITPFTDIDPSMITSFNVTEQQLVPQKSLQMPGVGGPKPDNEARADPQRLLADKNCKCIWQIMK